MNDFNWEDFETAFKGKNITEDNIGKKCGDIFDLAKAFLSIDSMTHKKLQKLCYYAKAWYLAINDMNLIEDSFEAWVHGAVQPMLYQEYKVYGFGYIPMYIDAKKSIPEEFLSFAKEIYESYGDLDGNELEKINHSEDPWIEARGNLKPWQGCNTVISEDSMKKYYRDLMDEDE